MVEKVVQSLNVDVNAYPLVAWCQENKFSACLIIFFLCNAVEQQLMATGAFEITIDGEHLWSKLESGRLPSLPEVFSMLEERVHSTDAIGKSVQG